MIWSGGERRDGVGEAILIIEPSHARRRIQRRHSLILQQGDGGIILHYCSWSIFTQGGVKHSLSAMVTLQFGMKRRGEECNPNGPDMVVIEQTREMLGSRTD